jgi:hypothetical protein
VRSRVAYFATAMAVLALACAVQVPPSGGPDDKSPPAVVATTPRADSTGVDRGSAIAITFGENMTRQRVERLVTVQPPIEFDKVSWEGNTMVIQPRGELQRDTTYVVRLKPGYRDQHGVVGTSPREFAFATGAALDTAYISGTVLFKREPSGKAVVRAFRVPRDSTFQPEAARPDRETGTARDGTFKVKYLPANEARFVLMAFVDQNGNGTFDKAEPFAVLPDTIALTPQVTQFAGVQINVIDPNEKGIVRGTVANETGIDSVLATVALYAPTDTTHARYLARCDSAGVFAIAQVTPAAYRLWAFLDVRADSLRGEYDCGAPSKCVEPRVAAPDSVVVGPGATVNVGKLTLRRREK